MTHEELFSAFPLPWRLSEENVGVVLCADGGDALTTDSAGRQNDEHATALAEFVADAVNERDELLATLRELVDIYRDDPRDCDDEHQPTCIKRAMAALAKAGEAV